MIVVDTNVVIEPMRLTPDPAVTAWLDAQAPATLFLATTSLAGLTTGTALLPAGRRRSSRDAALGALLQQLFPGRILPFDEAAALRYGPLVAAARRAGRAISIAGVQIASIAASRGFAVASRDAAPFRAAGIAVIDPWQPRP